MADIIFCTCPDHASAQLIAQQIVKKKFAACVTIITGVQSVFQWENQIEQVSEVLLMIKSPQTNYDLIEKFIRSQHPYETPEIIAINIHAGSQGYLDWINETATASINVRNLD